MSKNTIVAFLIGAVTGSVITYKYMQKKIDEEYVEYIDDVIPNEEDDEPEPVNEIDEKPDISVYTEKLKKYGYLDNEEGDDEEMNSPVVISPEEYGELDDYTLYSYVYYADKVLADENNKAIKNVDEIVGEESLKHFGEYGDDSVYVRNDDRKAYYEILLDESKFVELFGNEMEKE